MYLPSRVFGTAMVLRSLLLWTGIRTVSLGLGSPPTIGGHSALVVFLVVFLSGHDNAILNERVLLANAGVARFTQRVFALVPAITAETALHLLFM